MAGQLPYQALPEAPRPAPRWNVGTVLLALVPVVSLGLLAFVPAAVLAVLRRTLAGWVGLAVMTAMTCVEAALAGSAPDNDPGSLAGFYFIVTIVGSVLYYVVSLTRWQRSLRRLPQPVPYYPQAQPLFYPQPRPQSQPQQYPNPNPYATRTPAPAPTPAPVTEDVGAELRRLSERLRGPQEGGR